MRSKRFDWVLAAILACGGLLIFWGLGTRDLWEDEAETALLAKNVLRFGVPRGFDGLNFVSTEAGQDLGPGYVWKWSPWVQFYLAAGSMKVFGAGTLGARLVFAVLGFACLPMTWLLARRLFESERIARFSALILATSVPFLLHVRQCRWYAPAYLLILGLWLSMESCAWGLFVLCGVLLFYTNYFIAIGALAALCLAGFHKKVFLSSLVVAAFAAPGIYFFDVLSKTEGSSLAKAVGQLWTYVGFFLTFILPLPVLPFVERKRPGVLLMVFCAALIAYLSLGPWKLFRYVSVLAPAGAILAAAAVDRIWRRSPLGAGALLALLCLTNVLHMVPWELAGSPGTAVVDRFPSLGPVRFPLAGYLYEISRPLADCDRAAREYLKANAGPGDVVVASYGDLPLQFYTGLKVLGGFQGQKLPYDPDWILLHPFAMDRRPGRDVDVARFILSRVDLSRYRKIDLACVDAALANCTEPAAHVVRLPAQGPALSLFRKI